LRFMLPLMTRAVPPCLQGGAAHTRGWPRGYAEPDEPDKGAGASIRRSCPDEPCDVSGVAQLGRHVARCYSSARPPLAHPLTLASPRRVARLGVVVRVSGGARSTPSHHDSVEMAVTFAWLARLGELGSRALGVTSQATAGRDEAAALAPGARLCGMASLVPACETAARLGVATRPLPAGTPLPQPCLAIVAGTLTSRPRPIRSGRPPRAAPCEAADPHPRKAGRGGRVAHGERAQCAHLPAAREQPSGARDGRAAC
jgi:hypothetical protein